jgi:pyruvate/2-oxoglutarate dehydrogenase complex dihydrolipoamide acyltransferase (E2) component
MRITILLLLFTLQTAATANQPARVLFLPSEMTELHFNCNGVLGRIYVHKGSRFKKGALLVSLKYEDVNEPAISAAFYRNRAREAWTTPNTHNKQNSNPRDAELNYEKAIAAGQCYYLTADRDGMVVKVALKEGDPVSAGETVLMVK